MTGAKAGRGRGPGAFALVGERRIGDSNPRGRLTQHAFQVRERMFAEGRHRP